MGKIIQKVQENLFGIVFNSKWRSRLGLGVAKWEDSQPWVL